MDDQGPVVVEHGGAEKKASCGCAPTPCYLSSALAMALFQWHLTSGFRCRREGYFVELGAYDSQTGPRGLGQPSGMRQSPVYRLLVWVERRRHSLLLYDRIGSGSTWQERR